MLRTVVATISAETNASSALAFCKLVQPAGGHEPVTGPAPSSGAAFPGVKVVPVTL
jgi:hypothetical protein